MAQGAGADRRSRTTSSAALVTPFVYRKYLDYDAYEGLRDIHRQIREQERRRDYADDIKLGPGGIREIEFIVQALQIVRGGREPVLRVRGTLPALAALASAQPAAAPHAVAVLERGLPVPAQPRAPAAVPRRPPDAAPARRRRRARALAQRDGLRRCTRRSRPRSPRHRGDVERQFARVFGDARARRAQAAAGRATPTLWDDPQPSDEVLALARAGAGFDDPAALVATLATHARRAALPAAARAVARALRSPRSAAAGGRRDAARARHAAVGRRSRLLALLEAVSGRSAYLALLIEHPPLLPRLAQLMGASAWAADYLTRHPLLLDELLDARVLLAPPDWSAWRDELARLLDASAGDAERQMDALRHFQHAQTFRLLAQDLCGTADHRAARRSPVGARRHDPRRHARPAAGGSCRAPTRRRRASRSSATASSAARSWATRRTSTSSSSTSRSGRARPTRARRSATRGSRSGSTPGSPARPRPAGSTRPTCGCAPTAPQGCSCRASPRSGATSASRRGPGSTRR